jgi:PAS domain S-box-containing protein
VLFVSPAYERVWGRSARSLIDDPHTLIESLHPDNDDAPSEVGDFFAGESERQYQIVRPDGSERWIRSRSFPVRNAEGEVYRVAGISEDITERKHTEEHLRHMALHDSLTGLPNRASLIIRLLRSLERVEHQPRAAFSVLFVDLDRL